MLSRPVAFAVLAAGCMAAAAGGAYVAQRQNAERAALAAPAPAANLDAQAAPSVATEPVEPIGRVNEPAQAAVEATETAVAPAKRREASSRPTAPSRRAAPAYSERSASNDAERTPTPVVEPPVEVSTMPASTPGEVPAGQVARFEEITIPAETVIGVQVDTAVSSERARVEDRIEGHVTRDVSVGGRVAIPAGTKMLGSVTLVDRGGKFKERARIAVRFHTAQLPDGTRLGLQTTAIMREGDSPSRETAAKVGGSAVGGAILGAILGGAKGAVIGGTAGAGAGTAVVMASDRNAATLPAGTTVSVRLMSDVRVTVER